MAKMASLLFLVDLFDRLSWNFFFFIIHDTLQKINVELCERSLVGLFLIAVGDGRYLNYILL